MSNGRSRRAVRALAGFTLFFAIAGQFWRNLLGWWGWGILAVLVLGAAIAAIVVLKPRLSLRRLPTSAVVFVLLAAASTAWSAYPAETALGVAALIAASVCAVFAALCLSWGELVEVLGSALNWVLGLSLLFELWVSLILRHPLLPNFTDYGGEQVPQAFYWSRGLLFAGGPIDGIVANRNLLAMAALVALIVGALRLASGLVRRTPGVFWIVVAAGVLLLTRSATVILTGILVAAALGFALWARRRPADGRRPVYLAAAGALVAAVALLAAGWQWLLALLGRSEDLTGRLDIWSAVTGLAAERPWFGWGWVGYWPPWSPFFDDLAVRKGVVYLQAHNAWLDVWMQLGILGLIVFASVVVGTLWRSWFLAIDRPRDPAGEPEAFTPIALLPLLVTVALIGQSLAESRVLTEGGWLLLVVVAVVTKQRQWHHEPLPVEVASR